MNNHPIIKTLICALFLIFVLPSAAFSQINTNTFQQSDSEPAFEITNTITFSKNDFYVSTYKGYDTIILPEYDSLNVLGEPMLPKIQLYVALQEGMKATSVHISHVEKQLLPGEFNVLPAQHPLLVGTSFKDEEFIEPNPQVYSSTEPYPSSIVEFQGQTDLAGQGMAVLTLCPIQYIPLEKQVFLLTSLEVIIQGVPGYRCGDYLPASCTDTQKEKYQTRIEQLVINPEEVSLHTDPQGTPLSSSIPPGGPFNHVIITTNSYESYWAPLVEWHTKRGLRDTVVTTDYIYSNYDGSFNQERIRNFIIDAHEQWSTEYFLLAGEHYMVPFEYRTLVSDKNTPSDQYYSDYDDDWDHEVYVGRVTTDTVGQISDFISKVLNYERNPPMTGYLLDALFIGMDTDEYTHYENLKESVASNYMPQRFTVTKVYDSDDSYHLGDTLNALNSGQHLVNHADHGYYDYMGTGDYWHQWGMNNNHVDYLHNDGELSIVTSFACLSNGMDVSDSISEHFVVHNPNQAGLAFTGNTRVGFYTQGNPLSHSGLLDLYWWKALFYSNQYILGETIIKAKDFFNHDAAIDKHCEWTFNLLGEPAMPIWTDTPIELLVTHPETLPIGTSSFDVHVEDDNNTNMHLAYVCLWKGEEVYLTGYTDTEGNIIFELSPDSPGTMYVTVTIPRFTNNFPNCLPYEGIATVEEGGIPGDIDGDGDVDTADLLALLAAWGNPGGPADINGDGIVNTEDLLILLGNWG